MFSSPTSVLRMSQQRLRGTDSVLLPPIESLHHESFEKQKFRDRRMHISKSQIQNRRSFSTVHHRQNGIKKTCNFWDLFYVNCRGILIRSVSGCACSYSMFFSTCCLAKVRNDRAAEKYIGRVWKGAKGEEAERQRGRRDAALHSEIL